MMLFLGCEQAPKWGIGRKEKSVSRASRARSIFCLRPIPHLGAWSQAMLVLHLNCPWGKSINQYPCVNTTTDLSQGLVPSRVLTFTVKRANSTMQTSLPSSGFTDSNVDGSSVVASRFCRRLKTDSFFFRDLGNFTHTLFRLLDIHCIRYCNS